jgi:hypothetical protein
VERLVALDLSVFMSEARVGVLPLESSGGMLAPEAGAGSQPQRHILKVFSPQQEAVVSAVVIPFSGAHDQTSVRTHAVRLIPNALQQ